VGVQDDVEVQDDEMGAQDDAPPTIIPCLTRNLVYLSIIGYNCLLSKNAFFAASGVAREIIKGVLNAL